MSGLPPLSPTLRPLSRPSSRPPSLPPSCASSVNSSTNSRRDNLFRECIPRDIVNEVLAFLKFNNIEDTRVFTMKDLKPGDFDPALLLLEPYYIPCKARKYLYGEMTPHRIVTILRQILRTQGYGLISQERTISGKKELHYQIQPMIFNDTTDSPGVNVDFS
jgi:hypothetical protein